MILSIRFVRGLSIDCLMRAIDLLQQCFIMLSFIILLLNTLINNRMGIQSILKRFLINIYNYIGFQES